MSPRIAIRTLSCKTNVLSMPQANDIEPRKLSRLTELRLSVECLGLESRCYAHTAATNPKPFLRMKCEHVQKRLECYYFA